MKSKQELIKLVLKTCYSQERYKKEQLGALINDIIDTITNECENCGVISTDDIINTLVLHIHLNKDQLYFIDVTRKREKFFDKYNAIFRELVIEKPKPSIKKPFTIPPSNKIITKPQTPVKTLHTITVQNPLFNYSYTITKPDPKDEYNGPYGTQWRHEEQVDDILTVTEKARMKKFAILRAIKLPEQRSKEWFAMRDGKITASDGGCVVGMNHYEPTFNFVLKKIVPKFQNNMHCYHGKKYEQIATMIYEFRMNVQVEEFGLLGHPVYNFLGASPDGICSPYKRDKTHLSKYVGRMLEIKCPVTRRINKSGEIKGHICPIYYWVQVQLQLECCDLDECDFWQCSIFEYPSRKEFLDDTDLIVPYKSKKSGYEKGCLIQLLPKSKAPLIANDPKLYLEIVWADASFIYPETVEMTPIECDNWILNTIESVEKDPKYKDVYVDRVVYWRLTESKNVLIERDRNWFSEYLPKLAKVWSYVEFFRASPENANLYKVFSSYVEKITKGVDRNHLEHYNDPIMETLEKMCTDDQNTKEYQTFIQGLSSVNDEESEEENMDPEIPDNNEYYINEDTNNNTCDIADYVFDSDSESDLDY
jgi:putative phage-type endonuclease